MSISDYCKSCRNNHTEKCRDCLSSVNNDGTLTTPSQWNLSLEDTKDMVNNPQYYQSSKGLEVIDAIEAFTEGLEGIEAVCTANVLKYVCRWNKKNSVEDLKKAEWYLTRLIRHRELVDPPTK